MTWAIDNKEQDEAGKIKWDLVPYTRGAVFDLGCGAFKPFPHFVGVDSGKDQQIFGNQCKPDISVPDAAKLELVADGKLSAVFSSHLLEHIIDYKAALKEWWRVIKPEGYLCLYLPHKDFYPNIGQHGSNPDHKHDFMPDDIISAMREVSDSWDLVENQDRNGGDEYSFFQVYQKTTTKGQQQSWKNKKPDKTVAVFRFGAFGDMLQTSSVCAALKKQGYHVTLFCEPRGYEVGKTDPHIDRFIIQDKDQVPNHLLGPYWDYMQKLYDKTVNLCESVEGSLLALPDRMPYRWSHDMRHKHMNKNYLEFMHDVAGTPYKWFKEFQKFYSTPEEREWAKLERAKIKGPAILWAMNGSSCHKTWVWIDPIWARLLEVTDAVIVTAGNSMSQMLEKGWEENDRVWCRSGKWTIRETLAFAQQCDLVIGPETGVLNAVAFEKTVMKICFLSHSSVENLTRDWINTVSMFSTTTACYPCHMMHYSWERCIRTENSASHCSDAISVEAVWTAIVGCLPDTAFKVPQKRVVERA